VALSAADKTWIRKALKDEIKSLLDDMVAGQVAAHGGYDGATSVTDDEWAEEGRKRPVIGFLTPTRKGPVMT
jgi:hypothetical protein